ncbi:MAG: hypothetical protein L6Q71_06540 [Planctomycetes bacterium]|nr:hypothetical protein [Planctomycetota bacterium]
MAQEQARVRVLTAPFTRQNENIPLVIELAHPAREAVVTIGESISYRIVSPAECLELAVFAPARATQLTLALDGAAPIIVELPRATVPRDERSRLVAVFSRAPVEMAGLLGERLAPATALVHRNVADLPAHWDMLTAFDAVVFASSAGLSPQQSSALEGYLASGGIVAVFGSALFEGGRAAPFAALRHGVTTNASDGTTITRYGFGAGQVLHIPRDIAFASSPVTLAQEGLTAGFTRGQAMGGDNFGPPLFLDQPVLRINGSDQFKALAARQGSSQALMLLVMCVGVAALACVLSFALPARRRFAIPLMTLTTASIVVAALAIVYSEDTPVIHHQTLLAGADRELALTTSIIASDPRGTARTLALDADTVVTPLDDSANMRFDISGSQRSVTLAAGSAIRVDKPLILTASLPETELATLHGGRASSPHFSGDVHYRDLPSALGAALPLDMAPILDDWLERHVWGGSSWRLWLIDPSDRFVGVFPADNPALTVSRILAFSPLD